MRVLVTGTQGQLSLSLLERGLAQGAAVFAIGRPDLDLAKPSGIIPILERALPDIVVNAAAYTAVDKAEAEPVLASTVNGEGAGAVASAAARLGVPIVHLSTDYVFDGNLDRPYTETDLVGPVSSYGRSKLLGEQAVAAANSDHAILRTAWVYSPFGSNFVKTMIRLADSRDEVSVVNDQKGSPTSALDLADGVLTVCRNLIRHPREPSLRGVFHITGAGQTNWAEFAGAIFELSVLSGGPGARVKAIPSREYPTAATRPANSVLDCTRMFESHGVSLPEWRESMATCVARLLSWGNR